MAKQARLKRVPATTENATFFVTWQGAFSQVVEVQTMGVPALRRKYRGLLRQLNVREIAREKGITLKAARRLLARSPYECAVGTNDPRFSTVSVKAQG
jgi:hypothetical protein